MTEIMPVPRNLNFTVLPAERLRAATFLLFTNDRLLAVRLHKGLGLFHRFRAGKLDLLAGAHVLAGHDARVDLVFAEEVDVGHLELVGVVHLGLELLLFRIDLRADARGAKIGRERDGLAQVLGHRQDKHVRRRGADVAIQKALLAEDIEQARHADRNADAGELAVSIVLRKVIVAAAGADRADLGVVEQRRLVHRAGVVVEAARDGQVDREVLLRHAERAEVLGDGRQLVEALVEHLVAAAVLFKRSEHLFVRHLDADEGEDLIRLFALDGVVVDQDRAHEVRADLFDLVDGAHDIAGLVGKAQHRVEAV